MQSILSTQQVQRFDHATWPEDKYCAYLNIDWLCAKALPCVSCRRPTFLDIGGGQGRFTDILLQRWSDSFGTVLDNSNELLGRNELHPRKQAILGSVLDLDRHFAESSVDVIFLNRILHHLVGRSYNSSLRMIQRALSQCRRILKPAGYLSIVENAWNGYLHPEISGRLIFLATSCRRATAITSRLGSNTAGVGVCYLSESGWSRLLQDCGLTIQQQCRFQQLRPRICWKWPLLVRSAFHVQYWCHPQNSQP